MQYPYQALWTLTPERRRHCQLNDPMLRRGRYAVRRDLCNECREGDLVPKVKGLVEQ